MNAIRRFLIWLVWDGPYLGPLAPWLLGLAMGSKPIAADRADADRAGDGAERDEVTG